MRERNRERRDIQISKLTINRICCQVRDFDASTSLHGSNQTMREREREERRKRSPRDKEGERGRDKSGKTKYRKKSK